MTVQDLSETGGGVRWPLAGRCAVGTLGRRHELNVVTTNVVTTYVAERLAAAPDKAVGAALDVGPRRARAHLQGSAGLQARLGA